MQFQNTDFGFNSKQMNVSFLNRVLKLKFERITVYSLKAVKKIQKNCTLQRLQLIVFFFKLTRWKVGDLVIQGKPQKDPDSLEIRYRCWP